ncbi:hypothetical protein BSK59_20235 [Paenibacillus odorifer]|uniref:hypothetical protein n=1 Tax=Paenibacillus odorifer TaxID=189426 RepID=UPI00096C4E62|nr:hypothetical protein [Paenibacillus odorifer]OME51844.1 hypothetical protein BSK59_20235 [Paenibacillus odorifer]
MLNTIPLIVIGATLILTKRWSKLGGGANGTGTRKAYGVLPPMQDRKLKMLATGGSAAVLADQSALLLG